ncbi:MAG TPA: glycogen synthase GlgA [Rhizomicrobium sp.]|jgi:starch synthase
MISVLSVASEAYPLVKTGGLGDVVGALPEALVGHNVSMTTLLPGYPALDALKAKADLVHHYPALFGVEARLLKTKNAHHELLILDAPALFEREGGPYADQSGRDWPDNWRRFAALGRAAADLASGTVTGQRFDILHAHDWQAAMAPAYLFFAPGPGPRAKSVVTIHNIAFQGRFDSSSFASLGLPPSAYAMEGVEYYGGVGFLKAGLWAADAITTVSPTYAQEIRTPEFGMGLEGLIQSRASRLTGIVNGIDPMVWNPATDAALPRRYNALSLGRREINKRAIETTFGLESAKGPLFAVVTRLTWQKGMDVLAAQVDDLVAKGGRLALLGSGDAALETSFRAAAARHPGLVRVVIGYDEILSHLLQSGADAVLIPSRFEPCGLVQLYGLAYGCVPVAARTGGLADTIVDANEAALAADAATGVLFDELTPQSLSRAFERVVTLYAQPKVWSAIQRQGMKADFSWSRSGARYAALYASLSKATA